MNYLTFLRLVCISFVYFPIKKCIEVITKQINDESVLLYCHENFAEIVQIVPKIGFSKNKELSYCDKPVELILLVVPKYSFQSGLNSNNFSTVSDLSESEKLKEAYEKVMKALIYSYRFDYEFYNLIKYYLQRINLSLIENMNIRFGKIVLTILKEGNVLLSKIEDGWLSFETDLECTSVQRLSFTYQTFAPRIMEINNFEGLNMNFRNIMLYEKTYDYDDFILDNIPKKTYVNFNEGVLTWVLFRKDNIQTPETNSEDFNYGQNTENINIDLKEGTDNTSEEETLIQHKSGHNTNVIVENQILNKGTHSVQKNHKQSQPATNLDSHLLNTQKSQSPEHIILRGEISKTST